MRDALAPLREVDTIAHVIRVFDDPSVPHAEGSIDPLRDATNLELELMLVDHDQITRRLERLEKDLKKKSDPVLLAGKSRFGKVQGASGSGEASARTGVDSGRAQADRGIFVFVGAAGACTC